MIQLCRKAEKLCAVKEILWPPRTTAITKVNLGKSLTYLCPVSEINYFTRRPSWRVDE